MLSEGQSSFQRWLWSVLVQSAGPFMSDPAQLRNTHFGISLSLPTFAPPVELPYGPHRCFSACEHRYGEQRVPSGGGHQAEV